MNPLESTLPTSDRREQLIADCVRLIESQVASRGPMRRIAPGAALAVLEVIEPGALHRAVAHRLPDSAAALDRLNQQFLGPNARILASSWTNTPPRRLRL